MRYLKNKIPDLLVYFGIKLQFISVYLLSKGFDLHKKYGNNIEDKLKSFFNKLTKVTKRFDEKFYDNNQKDITNKNTFYINRSGNA